MENKQNPLSKFFRQPAIHIKLPSEGRYWPEDSLELPVTGEIPVYPLTTRDEVILRTPDALMNGSGVVDVIQSCIPSIKNAWHTPNTDVDSILIAIRIASYGETMDLESTCPHCKASNKHGFNLLNALSTVRAADFNSVYTFHKLRIKFCPLTFFSRNRQNILNFEQQKMLQALENTTISDEQRAGIINDSMQKLLDLGNQLLTDSTEYIEIDNNITVKEKEFILEFYNQVPATLHTEIQNKLNDLNTAAGIQAQPVQCFECTQQYKLPIIFDYASFFGNGS